MGHIRPKVPFVPGHSHWHGEILLHGKADMVAVRVTILSLKEHCIWHQDAHALEPQAKSCQSSSWLFISSTYHKPSTPQLQ